MLSFSIVSVGAERYYLELSQEASYYAEGDEPAGQWTGQGARHLGLEGQSVKPDDLTALMAGFSPQGKRLVHNAGRASRRVGIDFTFSADKSISVLWAICGDAAVRRVIEQAHDAAVLAGVNQLEALAMVRRGRGGKIQESAQGVFALFRHVTSRANDPQLHTHAVMPNVGFNDLGQSYALKNDKMMRSIQVVGALYREVLVQQLQQQLGLVFERRGEFLALQMIPSELVQLASTRRTEILAYVNQLVQQGVIRDAQQGRVMQVATLATRPAKTVISTGELWAHWEQLGRDFQVDVAAELAAGLEQMWTQATLPELRVRQPDVTIPMQPERSIYDVLSQPDLGSGLSWEGQREEDRVTHPGEQGQERVAEETGLGQMSEQRVTRTQRPPGVSLGEPNSLTGIQGEDWVDGQDPAWEGDKKTREQREPLREQSQEPSREQWEQIAAHRTLAQSGQDPSLDGKPREGIDSHLDGSVGTEGITRAWVMQRFQRPQMQQHVLAGLAVWWQPDTAWVFEVPEVQRLMEAIPDYRSLSSLSEAQADRFVSQLAEPLTEVTAVSIGPPSWFSQTPLGQQWTRWQNRVPAVSSLTQWAGVFDRPSLEVRVWIHALIRGVALSPDTIRQAVQRYLNREQERGNIQRVTRLTPDSDWHNIPQLWTRSTVLDQEQRFKTVVAALRQQDRHALSVSRLESFFDRWGARLSGAQSRAVHELSKGRGLSVLEARDPQQAIAVLAAAKTLWDKAGYQVVVATHHELGARRYREAGLHAFRWTSLLSDLRSWDLQARVKESMLNVLKASYANPQAPKVLNLKQRPLESRPRTVLSEVKNRTYQTLTAFAAPKPRAVERVKLRSNTVLVLDSAQLFSTPVALELLERAHRAGAQVVMIGDCRQVQSLHYSGIFRSALEAVPEAQRVALGQESSRPVEVTERKYSTAQQAMSQLAISFNRAVGREAIRGRVVTQRREDALDLNRQIQRQRLADGFLSSASLTVGDTRFHEGDVVRVIRSSVWRGISVGERGMVDSINRLTRSATLTLQGGTSVTLRGEELESLGLDYALTTREAVAMHDQTDVVFAYLDRAVHRQSLTSQQGLARQHFHCFTHTQHHAPRHKQRDWEKLLVSDRFPEQSRWHRDLSR